VPITRTSLLLRLRSGADPTGWSEFVRLYEPLLESFVRRAFVPEQDVPDVVQNILMRLIRALPRFEYEPDRGRFRAWLGAVCRTAVVDWRRARPQTVSLSCSIASAIHSAEGDPAWELEHRRHVLRHATAAVRSQVSASAWLCFERYVLTGQSAESVAAALQLTPAAVYVITSRIRARLRQKCAQFDEDFA
jgi:RNA polymerase sigma factor (sigma-70 family)